MLRATSWCFMLLVSAASPAAETYPVAVLQGLDKVTARVTTLRAPVGQTVRFGTLQIKAAVCEKRPPEETPEIGGVPRCRRTARGASAGRRLSRLDVRLQPRPVADAAPGL